MMEIRREHIEDIDSIREINLAAFKHSGEADLVDQLRKNCNDLVSLVAQDGDRIVGHILFSPVEVKTKQGSVKGMGLAPMAVWPAVQKTGIGIQLVEKGLEELEKRRCPFVVVLGHSTYYPKFGFEVASQYGMRCKWEVPDEAFMIKKLGDVSLHDCAGLVNYRSEFDALE